MSISLLQAAEILRMHPETVRARAKAGIIPGAKPGKEWVFLEEDLKAYLRSLYREESRCRSIESAASGTSTSLLATSPAFAALVAPQTKRKPRNTTTSSERSSGVRTASASVLPFPPTGKTRQASGS